MNIEITHQWFELALDFRSGGSDFNLTYPVVQCVKYVLNPDCCEMKAHSCLFYIICCSLLKANIPGQ